jgi:hypothetical protein
MFDRRARVELRGNAQGLARADEDCYLTFWKGARLCQRALSFSDIGRA